MHTTHKVLAVHNGQLCTVQIKLSTDQPIPGDEVGLSDVIYHCPRCGDQHFVPWNHGWIMCSGECSFMVLKTNLDSKLREHVLFSLDPDKLNSA